MYAHYYYNVVHYLISYRKYFHTFLYKDLSPFVFIWKQAKHGYKIENWFQGAGMIPNREPQLISKKEKATVKEFVWLIINFFPVNCKQRANKEGESRQFYSIHIYLIKFTLHSKWFDPIPFLLSTQISIK